MHVHRHLQWEIKEVNNYLGCDLQDGHQSTLEIVENLQMGKGAIIFF